MKDIQEVAAAFERQDYRTAAKLLKQLQKQSPENPWVQFYIGRWYEVQEKFESAEKIYRKLLRNATNPKVIDRARLGVKRLKTLEQNRRQDAITQAKTNPNNTEPGVLILEPIDPKNKQKVAQQFARIVNTDPYTARMQLQSRGWRLYRTGAIGELQVYGEEMLEAGIPVFWVSLAEIQTIHVFRVCYVQSLSPQPTVICQNEQEQLGSLTFNWSEINQRIVGLLPLFREAIDYDPRRRKTEQFRHKEMTQDYAQIYDLQLGERRSILRFCDQTYDFQQGIKFDSFVNKNTENKEASVEHLYNLQNTTRMKWNFLLDIFNQNFGNLPTWSDFTPFAETTLDYTQLLSRLKSHINLDRKSETPWDPAFQLYSGLVFLKPKFKV